MLASVQQHKHEGLYVTLYKLWSQTSYYGKNMSLLCYQLYKICIRSDFKQILFFEHKNYLLWVVTLNKLWGHTLS